MAQNRFPSMDLTYEVSFHAVPMGPVHAVVRAKNSYKAKRRTLCGLLLKGLGTTGLGEWSVGKNRVTPSGEVPSNPFFGPRGCEGCAQRLAL